MKETPKNKEDFLLKQQKLLEQELQNAKEKRANLLQQKGKAIIPQEAINKLEEAEIIPPEKPIEKKENTPPQQNFDNSTSIEGNYTTIGYADVILEGKLLKKYISSTPSLDTVFEILQDKNGKFKLGIWEVAAKRVIKNPNFADGVEKLKVDEKPTVIETELGDLQKDNEGGYIITKRPIIKFLKEHPENNQQTKKGPGATILETITPEFKELSPGIIGSGRNQMSEKESANFTARTKPKPETIDKEESKESPQKKGDSTEEETLENLIKAMKGIKERIEKRDAEIQELEEKIAKEETGTEKITLENYQKMLSEIEKNGHLQNFNPLGLYGEKEEIIEYIKKEMLKEELKNPNINVLDIWPDREEWYQKIYTDEKEKETARKKDKEELTEKARLSLKYLQGEIGPRELIHTEPFTYIKENINEEDAKKYADEEAGKWRYLFEEIKNKYK